MIASKIVPALSAATIRSATAPVVLAKLMKYATTVNASVDQTVTVEGAVLTRFAARPVAIVVRTRSAALTVPV